MGLRLVTQYSVGEWAVIALISEMYAHAEGGGTEVRCVKKLAGCCTVH